MGRRIASAAASGDAAGRRRTVEVGRAATAESHQAAPAHAFLSHAAVSVCHAAKAIGGFTRADQADGTGFGAVASGDALDDALALETAASGKAVVVVLAWPVGLEDTGIGSTTLGGSADEAIEAVAIGTTLAAGAMAHRSGLRAAAEEERCEEGGEAKKGERR